MRDLLLYGLPVVWAGVATVITLILYKSSEAVFSGDSLFGMPTKGLRLGGSIVIFAVIVVLLQKVTADNAALRADPSRAQVDRADLREMQRLAEAVELTSSDAHSCKQLGTPLAQCGADLAALHENARRLREMLENVSQSDARR